MNPIYTIGHSNHPWEEFVELLKMHDIDVVADVRSHPHSRYCPQFNREAMCDALPAEGIDYDYLGHKLGGRPRGSEYYEKGSPCYEKIAGAGFFRQGLECLLEKCKTHRIALMCAERDPAECHRMELIAVELNKKGIEVRHILASGKLLGEEDFSQRDFIREEKSRPIGKPQ